MKKKPSLITSEHPDPVTATANAETSAPSVQSIESGENKKTKKSTASSKKAKRNDIKVQDTASDKADRLGQPDSNPASTTGEVEFQTEVLTDETPTPADVEPVNNPPTECDEQSTALETPADEREPFEENNNLISLDELGVQINLYHAKAVASEEEALRNVWESGTRLNQAFDKIYEEDGYGEWGNFLEEQCPDLSRTTVWRYRKVATCFTLEQLTGLTLSEAYEQLEIVGFQEEPVDDTEDAPNARNGNKKKGKSTIPKLFKDVVKASAKFDVPVTMSKTEKSAVKKLGTELETVYGQAIKQSILGFVWQEKVQKEVEEWAPEEIEFFESEFANLQTVHDKLQSIKAGA